MTARLDALANYFENITEAALPQLRELYASDAYFKDPFNEVRNVADIERIFAHMYVALHEPRFVIHTRIEQGDEAFLAWDFQFRIRRYQPDHIQTIRGGSHVRWDVHSKVSFHRDYWDAAEELYEKLPVLGGLMRFVKKRMS
jgi:steroid delta-isomerase